MKIIVLQDHLRSGGTERQSVLLAREFASAGHEATLITFRPGGRLAASLQGVRHRCLQPFDSGLDAWAPGLLRAVGRLRPDIVLCMGKTANAYAGFVQRRLLGRGMRTAVVATLRAGYALPWYYARSIRKARHIVANSREAADLLGARHALPRERISVVHNSLVFQESDSGQRGGDPGSPEAGFGSESPLARREVLRSRMGAGAAATVLLCVAMFRPEKNQRDLIRIAHGLPKTIDWRLWLAGDGPARAECEELASRLGLGSRVRFLGFQSDPEPLYAAADVAVHASKEEALSNFVIEAQAHGLPAVVCRALGMEECFLPGRTGWMVEHGDPMAFQSAIVRLADAPPEERAARAAEARAFARSAFDRSRQVGAYLDLFRTLSASQGS